MSYHISVAGEIRQRENTAAVTVVYELAEWLRQMPQEPVLPEVIAIRIEQEFIEPAGDS